LYREFSYSLRFKIGIVNHPLAKKLARLVTAIIGGKLVLCERTPYSRKNYVPQLALLPHHISLPNSRRLVLILYTSTV